MIVPEQVGLGIGSHIYPGGSVPRPRYHCFGEGLTSAVIEHDTARQFDVLAGTSGS